MRELSPVKLHEVRLPSGDLMFVIADPDGVFCWPEEMAENKALLKKLGASMVIWMPAMFEIVRHDLCHHGCDKSLQSCSKEGQSNKA